MLSVALTIGVILASPVRSSALERHHKKKSESVHSLTSITSGSHHSVRKRSSLHDGSGKPAHHHQSTQDRPVVVASLVEVHALPAKDAPHHHAKVDKSSAKDAPHHHAKVDKSSAKDAPHPHAKVDKSSAKHALHTKVHESTSLTSLVEVHTHDSLHAQAHAHMRARAKAMEMSANAAMLTQHLNMALLPGGTAFGRGLGGGRDGGFMGPSEFDNSWWQPPPSVGGDPFLQGYSQRVQPQSLFGYGGMPGGGFGTAHHYWGGPSYKYPLNQPWWRGRSANMAYAARGGQGASPYLPYQTPRDSYGLRQPGMGSSLPVSSPYYYTPPPLQGDWNLPRSPPLAAAAGGEKVTTEA